MIKKKFKTLKLKKRNLLAQKQLLIEEEQGYEILIDNIAFFVYEDIDYGWIVVDQMTGISFSKHFRTRNEAIEDMKKKMKLYYNVSVTKEYQELLRQYQTLTKTYNDIINGQMTIFDYE